MVYAKQLLPITASGWTAFVTNANCNQIVFRNISGVVVFLRTNPNDATTQDALNPGDQEVIPGIATSVRTGSSASYTFPSGTTVCYFSSSSGNQNILATLFGD